MNKVAVTSAPIPDAQGLKHIFPSQGAVYGKGYCVAPASLELARRGCHNATIKRKGMHGKDRDKDRWYSRLRAPYERVFSQQRRRVSYRGIAKNQFSEFLYALCFNLKRLLVLIASGPPLHLQLA